jgi:protein SCO1/2
MTAHNGQPVTLQDLKGKVWIADFIFTRCGGQCPLMTQAMKRLHGAIPGVTFVSVTSDPEYDTPEILAKYAENQGAVADNWLFLRAEREELDQVSQSFHMGTIEEPLMHSTRFMLVDGNGRIRGYYDSAETGKIEQLKTEAAALLVRNRS